ncbi:hypothetical protein BB558_003734 [Smittium angustum]|uniref:Elongation factor 1 alpha-like protein n=1 Tax=Smittium angustum TaxID=133377 RepID=A0A2U1J5B0_SMIAN|nr:hypothetical protein BB558_003734 [Smittium angustum]
MSRHRAVRNLDYEQELYSEEEYDQEEKSEEDLEKLASGLKAIKQILGKDPKISDKEITDTLWYYYFDQEKTVSYLSISESCVSEDMRMSVDQSGLKNFDTDKISTENPVQKLSYSTSNLPNIKGTFSNLGSKELFNTFSSSLKLDQNQKNKLPSLSNLKTEKININNATNKLGSINLDKLKTSVINKSSLGNSNISSKPSVISNALAALGNKPNTNIPSFNNFGSLLTQNSKPNKELTPGVSNKPSFLLENNSVSNSLKLPTLATRNPALGNKKTNLVHANYSIQGSHSHTSKSEVTSSIDKLPFEMRKQAQNKRDKDEHFLTAPESEFAHFLFEFENSTGKNSSIDISYNSNVYQNRLEYLLRSEPSLFPNTVYTRYNDPSQNSSFSHPHDQNTSSSPLNTSQNTTDCKKIQKNLLQNINKTTKPNLDYSFLIVDIGSSAKKDAVNKTSKPKNNQPETVNTSKSFGSSNQNIESNLLQNSKNGKKTLKTITTTNNTVSSIIKPFNFDSLSPDDMVFLAQRQSGKVLGKAGTSKDGLKKGSNATGKDIVDIKQVQSLSLDPDVADVDPTPKTTTKKIDIISEYKKRNPDELRLSLVVVGHVDSGKSTLMGRLLYDLGKVNNKDMRKFERDSESIGKGSFAYAWVLDQTGEERQRGVTIDVATSSFQTKTRSFTLLDAPGHRDFIPNMISGASQADAAILVIDGSKGSFESGFERDGQTREHAMLVRSLGVKSLIVAVNKLETCDWSKSRFDEIRSKLSPFLQSCGFSKLDIRFIPVSGLNGVNLTNRADPKSFSELSSWYKTLSPKNEEPSSNLKAQSVAIESGPCLVELLDTFPLPKREIEKPLRIPVTDFFKGGEFGSTGGGSNVSICGRVIQGCFQIGDKVMLVPSGETAIVKSINVDYNSEDYAVAGDSVIVMLSGIDILQFHVGSMICPPQHSVSSVTRFIAQIAVFDTPIPITKGYSVIVHVLSVNEPAFINKLIEIIDKSTGAVLKKSPRHIPKLNMATVEITVERPILIDLYKNSKEMGRITLRKNGISIAAGIITGLFSN